MADTVTDKPKGKRGAPKGPRGPRSTSPLGFHAIEEADIPTISREGSQSHTLLSQFIESDASVAEIDVPADRQVSTVRGLLDSYAKRHNMPVRVMHRGGRLILKRLTDEEMAEAAAKAEASKAAAANGSEAPTSE